MTKVVNLKTDEYNIYIGRGSIFGNPFEIGRDGSRMEVIEKYEKWFNSLVKDPKFNKELLKLKNKTLGCFCHPEICHGDIIVKYLEYYE